MSIKNGRIVYDTRDLVKHHCAEGRCKNRIYDTFIICPCYMKLIRKNKNPTMCPYYNPMIDIDKFRSK